METTTAPKQRPAHKRNASSKSSIFRALVSPKSQQPTPEPQDMAAARTNSMPFLPPDHPHARHTPQPLGERQGNVQSPPSSPATCRGKDTDRIGTQITTKTADGSSSPKKSKSSANLSAMFAKMRRSSKYLSQEAPKDKENTAPPAAANGPVETPIWAQFARPAEDRPHSRPGTRDSKSSGNLANEIARYTPKDYSPSRQRNFNGGLDQPSLRPALNSRPHSTHILGTESLAAAIGRRVTGSRASMEGRRSNDAVRRASRGSSQFGTERPKSWARESTDRKVSDSSTEQAPTQEKLNVAKRGGRVMAAVAAFQGRGRSEVPVKKEAELDPKAVDMAFESVLEQRQIPEPMRQKMRSLTLRVKADFVKQHEGSGNSPPGSLTAASNNAQSVAVKKDPVTQEDRKETKRSRSRPRSRTFTFSKGDKRGDSPTKKERAQSKSRPTSVYIPEDNDAKPQSTTGPKSPFASLGRKAAPPTVPTDYIKYLNSNIDPAKVEVGRLHKLRILLRNETVAWVDSFLSLGGMTEIVGLLHRIMALEWREEHEDQLLHETLLCLKGLCTTEKAMQELAKVADKLFPALLAMLFDEEKKGPAEYSTRTVIINVLFNFLSSATTTSASALESHARQILTYLSEPSTDASEKPVDFVLDMRTPRPYRNWSREVSSVTKEVFWIFLHRMNIIPLPKPSSSGSAACSSLSIPEAERAKVLEATYTQRHFPGARPPVPAAPYIGGVEWDAATYITAHLDLLNGLIASLPSASARNALRDELRASGFERTMGLTLRTCKEKFYSGVHDGLRGWVAAATEDGWSTRFVREGPTDEEKEVILTSPKKIPGKKAEKAPKLEEIRVEALPKLELDLSFGDEKKMGSDEDHGWLE